MLANGCKNTPETDEQALRFGVVADIQYAEKPTAMGRYYADSPEALRRCVANLTEKDPGFVIQLGDMIDGGAGAEQELRKITGIYRQLPMPVYHTLGNHDFVGIDRVRVLSILDMNESYYDFEMGSWRFLVLDTQDMAIQGGWAADNDRYQQSVAMLERLKTTGAENAVDYNGGIGPAQKLWLEATLEQAEKAGKKVLVFGHLPLRPEGEKHTLWNGPEIVGLFEKYPCVKAYFCGHQHEGGYTVENGVHYVTFEAMVNAADKGGAWAVVTLSGDTIQIDGFGAVTTMRLMIKKGR